MQKGILAGRLQMARERIIKAAETGVADMAAGPLLLSALQQAQREKNPDVRALYELEAVGPIIEALAGKPAAKVGQAAGMVDQETILAIPGLTKTSREAIAAYFKEQNAGSD